MALEWTTPAAQHGLPGTLTVSVSLVPLAVVEQRTLKAGISVIKGEPSADTLRSLHSACESAGNAPSVIAFKPKPFGDTLRSGITQYPIPALERFGVEPMQVSIDELVAAYPDTDFDQVVINVELRFAPDNRDTTPLYPSDMIDHMRRSGISEEKIQDLLAWEKTLRGQA